MTGFIKHKLIAVGLDPLLVALVFGARDEAAAEVRQDDELGDQRV